MNSSRGACLDLSHVRPAGRAVRQAELARRLAALYGDGTPRTKLP